VCGDQPTQKELIDYDVFCGLASAAGGAGAGAAAGAAATGAAIDPREITAEELARALAGPNAPTLVDVREMWEWDVGNLEAKGAVHIPMAELLDRADELPEGHPVVAYCRVGNRSLDAVDRLESAGYAAKSLRGGLTDWKQKIDPSVDVA
jgi:adenylyltransferase/sulfurtransferase